MAAEEPSLFARLKGRRIVKDASWASLGTVGTILISLIQIRVISRGANTGQYGEASLVLGIVGLANGLLLGPLGLSHLRLLFSYQAKGLEASFERAFAMLQLKASLVCTGVYLLIAGVMAWRGAYYYLAYGPFAFALLIIQPFMVRRLNREEAARRQRRLNTAALVNQATALIVLSLFLRIGKISSACAVLGAQIVGPLASILWLRGTQIDKVNNTSAPQTLDIAPDVRRAVVAYGWSFPLAWFTWWIMSTSDRYFLKSFLTSAAVGAYAVNYGLWCKPFVLLNGTLETLTRPLIYRSSSGGEGPSTRKVVIARVGVAAFGSLFVIGLLLLFWDPICTLLLTSAYRAPRATALWIAIGYSFYVLAHSFTPVLLGRDKAHLSLVASIVGAVVSTAGNVVLIPRFGTTGAAGAAACGYLAFAIAMVIAARYARVTRSKASASARP